MPTYPKGAQTYSPQSLLSRCAHEKTRWVWLSPNGLPFLFQWQRQPACGDLTRLLLPHEYYVHRKWLDVAIQSLVILRKEVIQPQVPLRLPCYDLVPIAEFRFGACLPKVS